MAEWGYCHAHRAPEPPEPEPDPEPVETGRRMCQHRVDGYIGIDEDNAIDITITRSYSTHDATDTEANSDGGGENAEVKNVRHQR